MPNLIQFVGDPFVDTGVAVLEIRIGKPYQEFDLTDLAKQAIELEKIYSKKAWTGYLTVHFPNSCWCNATMGNDKKQAQKVALLRSFDFPPISERQCAYCRRPAQHIADRSTIPLLTGATTMTSSPGGEPGLPICSACQFSIQFYPLASLKVKGRPLFWWTLHHEWMYVLTLDFATRIRQMVEASPEQVPNIGYPSTQLVTAVKDVFDKAEGRELPAIDLIGCHATNYGSGPDYEEIRIAKNVLEFIKAARSTPAYRAIENAAWETVKKKTGKKPVASNEPGERTGRNFLFEELGSQFRADPIRPVNILIRYFKPQAGREPDVFELACLFARKVLEMTKDQIDAIKKLAEQIAKSEKAKDYLDRLFQRKGFTDYVRTLTNISDRMKRAGEEPLTTDTILAAFDLAGEDDAIVRNGTIVRELILLRLIEALPKERLQALPDISQEDQTQESEILN